MKIRSRRSEKWTARLALLILSILVSAPGNVQADPADGIRFEIVKIVDSDTPVPGGTGTFRDIGQASLSYGVAAFRGAFPSGLYVAAVDDPDSVTSLYNTSTPSPDGTGTLGSFPGIPSIDHGTVAFRAGNAIYTDSWGALSRVVRAGDTMPGSAVTFRYFTDPWLYDGEIAFRGIGRVGSEPWHDGIYFADASGLRMVADTNTPIPGGSGNFESFGDFDNPLFLTAPPSVDDGAVLFRGKGAGISGVYVGYPDGSIEIVADTNTLIPGATRSFTTFEGSFIAGHVHDGDVVFWGGQGIGHGAPFGIYLASGGEITPIVDYRTIVPGTGETFTNAGTQGFGFYRGALSFLGNGRGLPSGVYTTLGGALREVARSDDVVGGQPLGSLGTYGQSLSGNRVAFYSEPSGTHDAVYVASAIRHLAIDVKPGSATNPLQPKAKGTTPVAIFSLPAFDAPANIIESSLRFGRTGHEDSLEACNVEDIDEDGLDDLLCRFRTADTGFQAGDTVGHLRGRGRDRIPIRGSDGVTVLGR